MSNCKHCGQPFEPGDRNYSGSGHFNPYTCISNLRARAEAAKAAEAALVEARATIQQLRDRLDVYQELPAEAAALRARVAELEAQLLAAENELAAFKLETRSHVIEVAFSTPDGPQHRRYAATPLPYVESMPIDQDDEEE